jgi:hypothetical protein
MKLESGGVEAPPNGDGYMGLMQVGDSSASGGGSNCDWQKYDIHTTQGNINCGVQEMTNGYIACNNSWDGAILKYFTGQCDGNGNACDSFGTCASTYLEIVKKNWDYLNSQQGQAAPPAVPDPSSQASPPPNADQTTPDLPPPYILEAEKMNHGQSGDLIHDDQASGGLAMRLRGNGDLTATVNQLADQLTIRAKGEQCGGSPTMVLKMDGQEFDRISVDSSDWADYTATAPFDGASHRYTISFINDFTVLSGIFCDRNLFIDKSTLAVTNPNVATVRTLSEQLIEAEDLSERNTTSDSKPEVKSESVASGGKYVLMVDNSSISDTVSIEKGNWIKVQARGSDCQGWPHMVVKLDSTVVLEVDVMSTSWTEYSTLLNLPAGTGTDHDLNISFSNDNYLGPLCDRNLEVDVVKIQDNSVSQSTAVSNSLIGKTKYVGFNQLIGYVSAARDHEKEGTNYDAVPNANQTYLSYRIMYNNPNMTTFPPPDQPDAFINARVDNPYIIETADNTVAGSLKVAFDHLQDPMWFFCALRTTGNSVKCIDAPNPY